MHSHSGVLSSSERTRSVWHFGLPSGVRVGLHPRALNTRTAVDDTGALAVSLAKLTGYPSSYAGLQAL